MLTIVIVLLTGGKIGAEENNDGLVITIEQATPIPAQEPILDDRNDRQDSSNPEPVDPDPVRHDEPVVAPTVNVGTRLVGADAARQVICQPTYSWPCEWAMSVVRCESGYDSGAIGREFYQGKWYEFRGYWQVAWGSTDPVVNTQQAHIQYFQWQQGLRANPWPNCP